MCSVDNNGIRSRSHLCEIVWDEKVSGQALMHGQEDKRGAF
jgi:hypothetical protein